MVTDPPYGLAYGPKWRAKAGVNKSRKKMGVVQNDDRADWREAWALFPGSVAYVWCASTFNDVVISSLDAVGFARRSQIIWSKDRFALGRGHYHWQHEPCWYVTRSDAHWNGDRSQSTHLAYQGARGGPWPRHAEAGRVHVPPEREQQPRRRRRL